MHDTENQAPAMLPALAALVSRSLSILHSRGPSLRPNVPSTLSAIRASQKPAV